MEYYHDSITQKSWQELQLMRKELDFILLGGWAIYFYTKKLKSKDIDILINYEQLPLIEKKYRLYKNDRLHKYEAVKEEAQIDIYLPHYSQLGIPGEILFKQFIIRSGFKLLEINYLFVLKIYTLAERGRSPKGRKDFLDLLSLYLSNEIDFVKIKKISSLYLIKNQTQIFQDFLNESTDIPELNLNAHYYAKIKKDIINTIRTWKFFG